MEGSYYRYQPPTLPCNCVVPSTTKALAFQRKRPPAQLPARLFYRHSSFTGSTPTHKKSGQKQLGALYCCFIAVPSTAFLLNAVRALKTAGYSDALPLSELIAICMYSRTLTIRLGFSGELQSRKSHRGDLASTMQLPGKCNHCESINRPVLYSCTFESQQVNTENQYLLGQHVL